MEKMADKNQVFLIGRLEDGKLTKHVIDEWEFYEGYLLVARTSGTIDRIPIQFKKELVEGSNPEIWTKKLQVQGKIITYNDRNKHLHFKVYVRNLFVRDEQVTDENRVQLEGTICKRIYRETPFGRKIVDLILASNGRLEKSIYVPSIAWWQDAEMLRDVKIGTRIFVEGRIQSRRYRKQLQDDSVVERETYELSINHFEWLP